MTNLEKFHEIKVRAVNMWLNGTEPDRRWWMGRIAEILKVNVEDELFVNEKD